MREVVPVAASGPKFPAGTYQRHRGATTCTGIVYCCVNGVYSTESRKLPCPATFADFAQVVSNCAGESGVGDSEGDEDGTDLMSRLMEEVRLTFETVNTAECYVAEQYRTPIKKRHNKKDKTEIHVDSLICKKSGSRYTSACVEITPFQV